MLTRETFVGPWAGLPVAWDANNRFDEATYRADVARCCEVGMPGVYTAGTTGEFYAMELDEFKAVAKATVEEAHAHGKPVMIGCTSTYTRGAVLRAEYAATIGADAVQAALPFWMEVPDSQVVPYYKAVADAADGLAFSIYETTRCKKPLTLEQHQAVKEAIPQYLMVKANDGTIGDTPEGCEQLSQFVNVFVNEFDWDTLGPKGAIGCCSSVVYWNPRIVLSAWELLHGKRWDELKPVCDKLRPILGFLVSHYAPKGFTDTAYDRLGGLASGFLQTSLYSREPYPHITQRDVEDLRAWYQANLPEMLEL